MSFLAQLTEEEVFCLLSESEDATDQLLRDWIASDSLKSEIRIRLHI